MTRDDDHDPRRTREPDRSCAGEVERTQIFMIFHENLGVRHRCQTDIDVDLGDFRESTPVEPVILGRSSPVVAKSGSTGVLPEKHD